MGSAKHAVHAIDTGGIVLSPQLRLPTTRMASGSWNSSSRNLSGTTYTWVWRRPEATGSRYLAN
ncbi:hypothetical protein KGY79_07655 [Candidatus Bipolaricaulota bacterium]|nr:hypothetical protein [Candidatus Bipolaricaulota bacterium]